MMENLGPAVRGQPHSGLH